MLHKLETATSAKPMEPLGDDGCPQESKWGGEAERSPSQEAMFPWKQPYLVFSWPNPFFLAFETVF